MIDSKIGFVICETASSEPQDPVIVGEKNNRVTTESIGEEPNRKVAIILKK